MSEQVERETPCRDCGKSFLSKWQNQDGVDRQIGCTICLDCREVKRKATEAEAEERQRQRTAERIEAARESRREESGLLGEDPKQKKTLEGLRPREAVRGLGEARALLQDLIPGCFETDEGVHIVALLGSCGLGKSHLAVAAGWRALAADIEVKYYRVPALVSELNSTLLEDRRRFDRLWGSLLSISFLILDDFGTEKWTENTLSYLDNLVSERYRDCGHILTIITTNLLLKQIPERIASRLQDKRVSRIFHLVGSDYRLLVGLTQPVGAEHA